MVADGPDDKGVGKDIPAASEPVDLTIVIVSYNCLDHLRRSLSSLVSHPPTGTSEIIVVDNASSDGTVQWLPSAYPAIIVVPNAQNVGYGVAVNIGIRLAHGRQFLLLNPDTEVTEGAVDRLCAFARSCGPVGVVGPRLEYTDGSPQPSARRFPSPWRLWFEVLRLHRLLPPRRRATLLMGVYFAQDETLPVDWVSGACHLIPRATWEQVGELTERTFCGFDDLDYCIRTQRLGLTNWFCADALVIHECGATVSVRWSPTELDALSINNVYVILQMHWQKWRLKIYCAAEWAGILTDVVLAGRQATGGDTPRSYRARARARLMLVTKLFLGIVPPIDRCDMEGVNCAGDGP